MKKSLRLSVVVCVTVIFLAFLASRLLISTKNVALEKLQWKTAAPMIVLNAEAREDRTGLLLLRLKDAKEQFIAGDWQASFSATGDILALGEFPPGFSSSTGQHLYIIAGGEHIRSISLDKFPDRAVSVQKSANDAYLLFETQKNKTPGFCISEWQKELTALCLPIQAPSLTKAWWDPASDHEVLAETTTGTRYRVDPWNDGMKHPQRIDATTTTAATTTNTKASTSHIASRFFNFVVLTKNGARSIHRLPHDATLSWLDDGLHLLVTQTDHLSVYEVATRSLAPLLKEKDVQKKPISYPNKNDPAL